jgi:hypothetical protein
MLHRLKFRYVAAAGHLDLVEVWCPADHGGRCDSPELDGEQHTSVCDELKSFVCEIHAHERRCPEGCPTPTVFYECSCDGRPTGRCWMKENLRDWVDGSFDGDWSEVLYGDNIDLPWVSAQISGPGPDGHGPVEVRIPARTATSR